VNIKIENNAGMYDHFGYNSARGSGVGGGNASTSADYHTQHDRLQLINQSRSFLRNNTLYKGIIERAVTYTVGSGFGLQVNSGNSTYDKKVEQLWREWFKSPDVRGIKSGKKFAKLLCREIFVAGDTCVLKLASGKLQHFEAEQIAKGYKGTGITLDKYGCPKEFHLAGYSSRGNVQKNNSTAYNASLVQYLCDPERGSQTRGIPALQSAFSMLHRINDVCDSEAISWQLLARIALSITGKDAQEDAFINSKSEQSSDGETPEIRIQELDTATIYTAPEGTEIKGVDRNLPGKDFPDSIRMFLRFLGLPLGLPLELILLDWTKSNYSQSKAVLEQAYQTFQDYQELLEDNFYTPILLWKIDQWTQEGLLKPRKNCKHSWIKPKFPWFDQLKEATANALKVDRGFATHSEVCIAQNKDRDQIIEQRHKEILEAIGLAKNIYEKTGQKVDYRLFCGLEQIKEKEVTNERTTSKND